MSPSDRVAAPTDRLTAWKRRLGDAIDAVMRTGDALSQLALIADDETDAKLGYAASSLQGVLALLREADASFQKGSQW